MEARPGASLLNAIGLVDVESGCVYGLLDLLERRWWSRLWIVQEAALARDPVIHCGNQVFDFRRLEGVLRVLTTMISDELLNESPVYLALAGFWPGSDPAALPVAGDVSDVQAA